MKTNAIRIGAGLLLACALGLASQMSKAQSDAGANAVTTGQFIVERPTLLSLGFEWVISGDANRNANVAVTYRKAGEQKWLPALPLMRLQNERLDAGRSTNIKYTAPNAFSGSVLDLTPGTNYEVHFKLSDPDGISGDSEKTVTVKTRAEPMPAPGGHVYHVYPADWKGPRQQPAFTGLIPAYFTGTINGDLNNTYPVRVQPGDTILIHAGVYIDQSDWYMGNAHNRQYMGNGTYAVAWPYGAHFDGTYYLKGNGTPDKPIVIKAAGDGEVIFDGHGNAVLFDLTKANYNYFEGITVRNTAIAFLLGRKDYWGSDGFTLKHSKIYDIARGVFDDWGHSKDIYIADNVFTGRHRPDKIFVEHNQPFNGPNGSELAVKVYGQGHVVAYNKVENFHDGIDIATYGLPDNYPNNREEDLPSSIDFYNNDITTTDDNCYEMDGGARNIRYFRNRCFNVKAGALSISPGLGGPLYYFQNIVYNCQLDGVSFDGAGLLFYQNTWFCDIRPGTLSNLHFRNNLLIGNLSVRGDKDEGHYSANGDVPPEALAEAAKGPASGPWEVGSNSTPLSEDVLYSKNYWGTLNAASAVPHNFSSSDPTPTGKFPIFQIATATNYSSSDYNGFFPNPGAPVSFAWTSPAFGTSADYDHALVKRSFKTFAEYVKATGQDKHSMLVDYTIFRKASPPDRSDPDTVYHAQDYDFQLKPHTKAIDAGMVLPTINDDFTGKAPDLGALEYGKPVPTYGPRE